MGYKKIYEANTSSNEKNSNILTSLSQTVENVSTNIVATFSDSQLIDFGLYADRPVILSTCFVSSEIANKQIFDNEIYEKRQINFLEKYNMLADHLAVLGEEEVSTLTENFENYELEVDKIIRLKKQIYFAISKFYKTVDSLINTSQRNNDNFLDNTKKIATMVNTIYAQSTALNSAIYDNTSFEEIDLEEGFDVSLKNSSLSNFLEPVFDSTKVRIFDKKGSNVGFKTIGSTFFVKRTVKNYLEGNKSDIAVLNEYISFAENDVNNFKNDIKQRLEYNEVLLFSQFINYFRTASKSEPAFGDYVAYLEKMGNTEIGGNITDLVADAFNECNMFCPNSVGALFNKAVIYYGGGDIVTLVDPLENDVVTLNTYIGRLSTKLNKYDILALQSLVKTFKENIKRMLNLPNDAFVTLHLPGENGIDDAGICVLNKKAILVAAQKSSSFDKTASYPIAELIISNEIAPSVVKYPLSDFSAEDKLYILSMSFLLTYNYMGMISESLPSSPFDTKAMYLNTTIYNLMTNIPGYDFKIKNITNVSELNLSGISNLDSKDQGKSSGPIPQFKEITRPYKNAYFDTQMRLLFHKTARANGFNNYLFNQILKFNHDYIVSKVPGTPVSLIDLANIVFPIGSEIINVESAEPAVLRRLADLLQYAQVTGNRMRIADASFQYEMFSKFKNYNSDNLDFKNYIDKNIESDLGSFEKIKKETYLEINFEDTDLKIPAPVYETIQAIVTDTDTIPPTIILQDIQNKTSPTSLDRNNYFYAGVLDDYSRSAYYNSQENLKPVIYCNYFTEKAEFQYNIVSLKALCRRNKINSTRFKVLYDLINTVKSFRDALDSIVKSDLIEEIRGSGEKTGIVDIANFDYISAEQIRLNILNKFYNRPLPQLNYFLQGDFPDFPYIQNLDKKEKLKDYFSDALICVVGIPYSIAREKEVITLNFVITDFNKNEVYSNKFKFDLTQFSISPNTTISFNGLEASVLVGDRNPKNIESRLIKEFLLSSTGIDFNERNYVNKNLKKGVKCVKDYTPNDVDIKIYKDQRYIPNYTVDGEIDLNNFVLSNNQLINPSKFIDNTTSGFVFDRIFACKLDISDKDIKYNNIAISVLLEDYVESDYVKIKN